MKDNFLFTSHLKISVIRSVDVLIFLRYFDAKTKIHLMNYIESRTDNNSALFVSLNKPHNRLTESGVELRLREMGKKFGVEKVHPHKFRRTMATRAIKKGMPIEQVQKILGHEQTDRRHT